MSNSHKNRDDRKSLFQAEGLRIEVSALEHFCFVNVVHCFCLFIYGGEVMFVLFSVPVGF